MIEMILFVESDIKIDASFNVCDVFFVSKLEMLQKYIY